MKGCMFCGPLNVATGDRDYWALAAFMNQAGTTLTSVYCQNTLSDNTKELWASSETNEGTKTNCAYVDGTTTTWATAIADMNTAISSDITGYHYVYDATLGCPKAPTSQGAAF